MFHHYLTKYVTAGKKYAASWIQMNLFGRVWCFSKKVEEL